MFPENTNAVNSKIDNIDKIKGRQQLNNKKKKKKKKKKLAWKSYENLIPKNMWPETERKKKKKKIEKKRGGIS